MVGDLLGAVVTGVSHRDPGVGRGIHGDVVDSGRGRRNHPQVGHPLDVGGRHRGVGADEDRRDPRPSVCDIASLRLREHLAHGVHRIPVVADEHPSAGLASGRRGLGRAPVLRRGRSQEASSPARAARRRSRGSGSRGGSRSSRRGRRSRAGRPTSPAGRQCPGRSSSRRGRRRTQRTPGPRRGAEDERPRDDVGERLRGALELALAPAEEPPLLEVRGQAGDRRIVRKGVDIERPILARQARDGAEHRQIRGRGRPLRATAAAAGRCP